MCDLEQFPHWALSDKVFLRCRHWVVSQLLFISQACFWNLLHYLFIYLLVFYVITIRHALKKSSLISFLANLEGLTNQCSPVCIQTLSHRCLVSEFYLTFVTDNFYYFLNLPVSIGMTNFSLFLYIPCVSTEWFDLTRFFFNEKTDFSIENIVENFAIQKRPQN